jgi:SAM-dependent methyltransferase
LSTGPATGSGPGAITPDGCAVDLYALLEPRGEAEMIHAAVSPGATVLELGCGTGRITRGLFGLGHSVCGVDFSAEMLARMPSGARTVLADIAALRLDERFDVVVLASNMVSGEADQALSFLRTARLHLAPGGVVIIERLHSRWGTVDAMRSVAEPRTRGVLTGSLHDISGADGAVSMTIRYEHADGRVWLQHATMHARSDAELDVLLARCSLRRVRFLDDDQDWLVAAAV